MKWFGDSWGAPVCKSADKVPVPISNCYLCDQQIGIEDCGFRFPFGGGPSDPSYLDAHLQCFLDETVPPEIQQRISSELPKYRDPTPEETSQCQTAMYRASRVMAISESKLAKPTLSSASPLATYADVLRAELLKVFAPCDLEPAGGTSVTVTKRTPDENGRRMKMFINF